MPVDDRWHLARRGPGGERVRSQRYGQGKRYRVRFEDASGKPRERMFQLKRDADAFDLACRAGQAPAVRAESTRQTFREYAERWRTSRLIAQSLDYQRHTDSRLRNQIYPVLGGRPIARITVTEVMEWIGTLLRNEAAQSSVRTYFDLLNLIMGSAMTDKVIPDNPCSSIRLSAVLKGLSRSPKWVPNDEQVLALLNAVPDRFRAAIWLGAGQGMRIGEVLGTELGTRCVDHLHRTVHVIQQLRFHKAEYGGFYLAPPKSGSVGDVDLDDEVGFVLAEHVRKYPAAMVELPDITKGTPETGQAPLRRPIELLFTTEQGRPVSDRIWARWWSGWRRSAGWPEAGTFHSLRHYFATTLITQGVEPTDVQKALRHASLRITLETYVHWWPKHDRRRNIISGVLGQSSSATGSLAIDC